MTSSNLLSNLQGFGNRHLKFGKKKQGMPKNLKRYSSERFLQAELEELEKFQQKRNTGVQRLWDHIRTGNLPNMRSYIHRELLGKEGWEEKCNSYFALMKSIGRKEKRKASEPDVLWDHPSCESGRLLQTADEPGTGWKTWGPYVSDRQWGTVREDYSEDGNW